jgi:peptidoglycan/xylan/chitin deacetylase (PgdA/CDA1 family)
LFSRTSDLFLGLIEHRILWIHERDRLAMPRFDRLATLYLFLPLTRVVGPKQGTRLPILMYHSISDNLFGKSHPYFHINTSPEVFSQQMRWLRHAGYRTLSLAEAWAGLESGSDLSKKVIITFDDGYRDFYTDAMDVMKQCGFTATIFLTTDRIRNAPARIEGADYLTWKEVRELYDQGIQFGAHTVTHPDLRSLGPEQIEYELGRSKEIIEQSLGAPLKSFSYPHAFPEEDRPFTRFLQDLLENQGFENGVSTIIGRAQRENNRFFLPRLPVNSWDDPCLFRAKLEGGYDWLHWPQLSKKWIFHNVTQMQRGIQVESKETE